MNETKGKATAAIAITSALAVIAGFFVSGGPMQARLENRDMTRRDDIQLINQNIRCQADLLGHLPEAPEETGACPADLPTEDPSGEGTYEYSIIDDRVWQVCAPFEQPGQMRRGYESAFEEFNAETGCFVSRLSGPGTLPAENEPMDQQIVEPFN